MLYTLENDTFQLTASDHGGELHSLYSKKTNTEYLWQGNPNYWKYRAPLLFPIVGRCINNKYDFNNKTYELPQHGLARTSEFTLIEQRPQTLTFELKSSQKSLTVYPFEFIFQITYTLQDYGVKTTLSVQNPASDQLLFSVGAHPAFMCPIDPADALDDCFLEFSEKETASIIPLSDKGFLTHQHTPYLINTKKLLLHKDLFEKDALIFDTLKSSTVSLKSKHSKKSLMMDFHEFPFFGIWAPKSGAPFLCLEPWHGHADYDDFTGDLKAKEGILSLPPNNKFICSFTVMVTE
jgi:galactose mutarotase-like enzyme